MNTAPCRPRTVEAYFELRARYVDKDVIAQGLAFRPRPSDVLVATHAKSGTTWMQQIAHGLRTGGSMAFDEITQVVPWLEVAAAMNIDLDAEQVATPRVFKTHFNWHDVPKGGRYITIYREPRAAAVSFFRFMQGWLFETGSISQDTFIREVFFPSADTQRPNYWDDILSWCQVAERDDVMSLVYEDMSAELPDIVRRTARFMGLQPDEETIDIATRQASFEFMKAHADQFDDNVLRRLRDGPAGLPPDGESNKVSSGQSGKEPISEELSARFDEIWDQKIARATGLNNYQELCQSVRERTRH